MAKAKTKDATEARALVDLPQFGAACGELFSADAAQMRALIADGSADADPAAVAAAQPPKE